MKPLSEDVIIDLLPLYFADEASAATRELVDQYFESHPQFAAAMRASQSAPPRIPSAASPNAGHIAIQRVRTGLIWRSALIAVGIFFSLLPLTFVSCNGRLEYFMLRDAPVTALVAASIALAVWIALWLVIRRAATPSLSTKEKS